MDLIILAGDHKKSKKVYSENKGFLIIDGKPIIVHLLINVLKVDEIENIYIIGPANKLDKTLKEYNLVNTNKKIFIFEQKETILQNAWEGFLQSIPEYREKTLSIELIKNKYLEKPVLFLSVDIPLLMPEDISYFISHCDLEKYDYFPGLTPEKVMKTYYPTPTEPGIVMAYLHFKEDRYRVSNIYLAKPFKIERMEYLSKMYDIRYQKNILNVFLFIRYILEFPNALRALAFYVKMQSALFFSTVNLNFISDFIRRFVPINEIEKTLSVIIGSKLKAIEIPFGGLAIDIDNEKDFNTLKKMFAKWKEKQKNAWRK